MSVVWALHEPVRFDQKKRCMVPLDISAASRFGRLRVVFPGPNRPPALSDCANDLKDAMAEFAPGDKLLLAGDLDLIAFAAVLAARAASGRLSVLKWDSRDRAYREIMAPEGLL